jgi:hypothetical protein
VARVGVWLGVSGSTVTGQLGQYGGISDSLTMMTVQLLMIMMPMRHHV